LVLNINTGNVSPQFHLKVDPTFQTMRQSFGNMPVKTKWLQKCKFVHDPELEHLPKADKVKAPEPEDINKLLPSAVHAAPEPKSRDAELPESETT
jgi:hypothetical protein